jgi:hypothetical protein
MEDNNINYDDNNEPENKVSASLIYPRGGVEWHELFIAAHSTEQRAYMSGFCFDKFSYVTVCMRGTIPEQEVLLKEMCSFYEKNKDSSLICTASIEMWNVMRKLDPLCTLLSGVTSIMFRELMMFEHSWY